LEKAVLDLVGYMLRLLRQQKDLDGC
jgi:hypothetical protein